jgi:predicted dehydrogenase
VSKIKQPIRDVALIGLGAIGFRHLQGLATAELPLRVIGIDPAKEPRNRAADEWVRTPHGNFSVVTSLRELPASIDVLIVATSARGRLRILNEVLRSRRIGKVILEKVAFTSREEFAYALRICAKAGTEAFVNCPRRLWPLYQELKQFVAARGGSFALHYAWQQLGLACNGVHFIDLLQYLSASRAISPLHADLRDVVPSKRPGYLEVTGSLEFGAPSGHSVNLRAGGDAPHQMQARLASDGEHFLLDELLGRLVSPDGTEILAVGPPPFQSALTGKVVDALLQGHELALPCLEESYQAHQALFNALIPRFKASGIDLSHGLPIT